MCLVENEIVGIQYTGGLKRKAEDMPPKSLRRVCWSLTLVMQQ